MVALYAVYNEIRERGINSFNEHVAMFTNAKREEARNHLLPETIGGFTFFTSSVSLKMLSPFKFTFFWLNLNALMSFLYFVSGMRC